MNKIIFLELFEQYIKYYRETKNYWELRKPITIEINEDKCNIVKQYLLLTNNESLLAIDFDLKFTRNLLDWLLNKYSHNHAVRLVEKCKSVLNFGAREELISMNPISFYKIKRQPPKPPPYLNSEQIQLIEGYTSKSIQRTKACAMLIVQLHTGYDFGDFAEISRHHIQHFKGRNYLVKNRHKNGLESIVELSPTASSILEKYGFKMKLLPNTTYNKLIKIIFAELGLNLRPCCKDIRKLFLMHKLNNEGYSIEAVSKMAGHKYTKTTEEYYVQKNINLLHLEMERRK
jgi:site-specific recombinase XerD